MVANMIFKYFDIELALPGSSFAINNRLGTEVVFCTQAKHH